ncbi:MAG: L-threonylcarbamoyladenylate synthase [Minisyncoccia bacterium]
MQIIKLEEVGVEAAALRAAAVLAGGGIIVYPTDTLYGLGVNALDTKALEKLRTLKVRDKKKPVSILMPSIEAIEWHAELPPHAKDIAHRFFPGALTLVLPALPHLPQELTFNDTIGVRVPADIFSRALAEVFAHPVTATSANLSGMTTPTTIPEMLVHFGARIRDIDLLIDAGPRDAGVPSTVVTFVNGEPRILREGAISKAELGF